jgi:hypothetical protein
MIIMQNHTSCTLQSTTLENHTNHHNYDFSKKITLSLLGGIPSNPSQNQGTFSKYIGELREHTLGKVFTEKLGSGGGRRRRSPVGGAREERGGGGREERRIEEKEEGRRRPNHNAQKGASLASALLYFRGTSDAAALPTNVAWTRVHVECLGCHHTWCPTTHIWCQPQWHPDLGSIYGISFPRGLSMKIIF